jgi:hypothetical protein
MERPILIGTRIGILTPPRTNQIPSKTSSNSPWREAGKCPPATDLRDVCAAIIEVLTFGFKRSRRRPEIACLFPLSRERAARIDNGLEEKSSKGVEFTHYTMIKVGDVGIGGLMMPQGDVPTSWVS